jgi:hypothetical protein
MKGRWPTWLACIVLFGALSTATSYFWQPMRGGLLASLQLALIALIATGSGRVLLRILRLTDISESQRTLIGATMGLGILVAGMFSLAALGKLSLSTVSWLLAFLWLVGFIEMSAVVVSLVANRNLLGERPLAAGFVFSILGLIFWTTWVPPHQYDSLVYHLPLAAAYARMGGFTPMEHLLFSHFPQNGELLFTLALILRSDILGQMFMWLASALAVWWIFELGKREAPLSTVMLACVLLVTHTSVMLLAGTTYVEPLVMLWVTAAVLSFLRWRQVSAVDPGSRSWLVLSAIFTGLALGTKYYAGITAAILGLRLLIAAAAPGDNRRARLLDLVVFVGLVTALFSPWMVKNYVNTGNPLFPFFYKWFAGSATGPRAQTAWDYFHILNEYGHMGHFWKDLLNFPKEILTKPLRFGGGMDVLGGLGWELALWTIPLSAWASRSNRFLKGMMAFCGLYLAAWFCTGVVLRFLTVVAPLLSLLAANGLSRVLSEAEPLARRLLWTATGILIAVHLLLFFYVHSLFQSANVLLGQEERESFLARRLDYYACARVAAERLDKSDKILLVGEQRGYYVEQAHATTNSYAPNPFIVWANEAANPAQLAQRMRAEGYGHVIFVPREAKRISAPFEAFTDKGRANWTGLEPDLTQPVYRGASCTLYAIANTDAR